MGLYVQIHDRRGARVVKLSVPPIACAGDLIPGHRACEMTLTNPVCSMVRSFDKILHFKLKNGGGMAFPELLRGYADLFMLAAEWVEGKQPIDFQI